MCVLSYSSFVCISAYANVYFKTTITKHKNNTNCGSAFEPGACGLPYYCTSPVLVPAVLSALAVWIQHQKKTKRDRNDSPILVIREIYCGDWLARGYMPAHQHYDLVYSLVGHLLGVAIN